MYLADSDLRKLLPSMEMTCPNSEHPFDEADQVQPASIDLRVSDVFWKPSRRSMLWRRFWPRAEVTIDLRRASISDLAALRDWKRVDIAEGGSITIRPGQILMRRIYERFQIPPGYGGKIEGRSSYARLGLSVHCTGDFINPGWRGYMPLQLCNMSPYPIRIAPYFSVCQLMIVKLTSVSERNYGDNDLKSKYLNDDGGPSLWWRDKGVERLQQRLGAANVTEAILHEIVESMRWEPPRVIERFIKDLDRQRTGQIENNAQVLDDFSRREQRRRLVDAGLLAGPLIVIPAVLSLVLSSFGVLQIVLIIASVLSVAAAIPAYIRRDFGYLGPVELQKLTTRPEREPS